MRAHQQVDGAAARESDLPGVVRRALRIGMRHGGVVVVMLALGACAGRIPAPVESRVDVPEAPRSSAGTPTSEPIAAASAAPEASSDAVEAGVVEATPEAEAPPPEPRAAGDAAPESESALTRLAALNPAVIDLLNAANEHSAAGRHDGAAAALERALKIEPADPGLWHRLARVRFAQGKPDLAEALAAKSNSLAAGDENLQAQNWRLIAKVRRKLGDASGAADAAARASRVLD